MRTPMQVVNEFRESISQNGYDVVEMEEGISIVDHFFEEEVMFITRDNKIPICDDIVLQRFFMLAMDKDEQKVFRPQPRRCVAGKLHSIKE